MVLSLGNCSDGFKQIMASSFLSGQWRYRRFQLTLEIGMPVPSRSGHRQKGGKILTLSKELRVLHTRRLPVWSLQAEFAIDEGGT